MSQRKELTLSPTSGISGLMKRGSVRRPADGGELLCMDKDSENSDYYEGEFAEHYAPSYIKVVARELRKNSTESCGKHCGTDG